MQRVRRRARRRTAREFFVNICFLPHTDVKAKERHFFEWTASGREVPISQFQHLEIRLPEFFR